MNEVVVVLLVIALCAAFGLLHKKADGAACSTSTSCGQSDDCATCELAPSDAESER